jgi:hypothetical protein
LWDIIDYMSGRLAALFGIMGAAALGLWINKKRRAEPVLEMYGSQGLPAIDVDDDTAAEIIRRARPALEHARSVY